MNDELIQKIANRAGELSLMKLAALRLLHPDNIAGTTSGNQWQNVGRDRLIADIIFEEFNDDDNDR